MKRLFMLLFIVILTACSNSTNGESDKAFNYSVEDYESRIEEALKQMGDKTNLEIMSSEVIEDGRQVITLSNNIMIFIESNNENKVTKVSLGAVPDAIFTEKEDLLFSFKLLVGTVDDSLNAGERSAIVSELEIGAETNLLDHTSVYTNNDIEYTYHGSNEENIVLQAKLD